MAGNRIALVGQRPDGRKLRGAIDAVATDQHGLVRGAQVDVRRHSFAMEETDLYEAIAGGIPHFRCPHRIDDREHVDSPLGRGTGLIESINAEHRNLSHALEGTHIFDSRTIVVLRLPLQNAVFDQFPDP